MSGRDVLLKIGDGGNPESFFAIAAARAVSMVINNQPADVTSLNSNGFQVLQADAGIQSMELSLDGVFKNAAAEKTLRTSAFDRTSKNYRLMFPNGDMFSGSFMIRDYHRQGSFDGMEIFSVTLIRTGGGTFTTGV